MPQQQRPSNGMKNQVPPNFNNQNQYNSNRNLHQQRPPPPPQQVIVTQQPAVFVPVQPAQQVVYVSIFLFNLDASSARYETKRKTVPN